MFLHSPVLFLLLPLVPVYLLHHQCQCYSYHQFLSFSYITSVSVTPTISSCLSPTSLVLVLLLPLVPVSLLHNQCQCYSYHQFLSFSYITSVSVIPTISSCLSPTSVVLVFLLPLVPVSSHITCSIRLHQKMQSKHNQSTELQAPARLAKPGSAGLHEK